MVHEKKILNEILFDVNSAFDVCFKIYNITIPD